MNRRGFLKTLAAAPVVAFVPGALWVPEQNIVVPELVPAMAPLVDAVGEQARIYGYFVRPHWWAVENYRKQLWREAASMFPDRAPVVIIATEEKYPPAFRFAWHGAGLPRANGTQCQIAQVWTNGEQLEPQLWLA